MRNLLGEGYEAYLLDTRQSEEERISKRRRLEQATEAGAEVFEAAKLATPKPIGNHGEAPSALSKNGVEAANVKTDQQEPPGSLGSLGSLVSPVIDRKSKVPRHLTDYLKPQELKMADMILIRLVGRGAFGEVWLAQDYVRNRFVALKKYYYGEDRDGFNKACLREISLLRALGSHPNIVPFHGVIFTLPPKFGPLPLQHPMSESDYQQIFQRDGPLGVTCPGGDTTRAGLWLAFDFYPYDLNAYMRSRDDTASNSGAVSGVCSLPIDEVKMIVLGILQALDHCHQNHVLHRDIKSANILLDFQGNAKLADFGLARRVAHVRGGVLLDDILAQPLDLSCEMDPRLTNKVVTLWYRSPELLLGSREYTASSDIWSVGCLVYEMISGKALFSATTEQQMIQLIFDKIPFPSDWPDAQYLPLYPYLKSHLDGKGASISTVQQNYEAIRSKVVSLGGADTWEFLTALLAVNPAQRLSAADALKHSWITSYRKNPATSQKFKIIMEHGVKGNSVTVRKERERLMNMQKQNIVRHINSSNPVTNKRLEGIKVVNEKLREEIKVKTQQVQKLVEHLKSFLQQTPSECQLEEGEIK